MPGGQRHAKHRRRTERAATARTAAPRCSPSIRGRLCMNPPSPSMNESEKSCVPSLLWVQVFQLAHAFDKMKSCRHKTYRHLILSWFRSGGNDLIGRRRGIYRQGETDRQKSLWIKNAARQRTRDVSPDGELARAENIPPILLRSLLQRAVSANGKKGTKTAKAEASAASRLKVGI